MYIAIFGADYCAYTRKLWTRLGDFTFVYIPFKPGADKEKYWNKVRRHFIKARFTFPMVLVLDGDSIREGMIKDSKHVMVDSLPIDMQNLKIPNVPNVPIVHNKLNLVAAFSTNKTFVFVPWASKEKMV
jgi:hypothetical protein